MTNSRDGDSGLRHDRGKGRLVRPAREVGYAISPWSEGGVGWRRLLGGRLSGDRLRHEWSAGADFPDAAPLTAHETAAWTRTRERSCEQCRMIS